MKKTYTTPTVVKHGNAVAVTLGNFGWALELINWRIGLP
ncbi:MAG TPA: lasso RiPP family leader peptide-containing protein [Longimicrobium sp.]